MPNRIIKESICTSEDIDALTEKQEIFFYRIMVNCDDFGTTDARIPILRAKCFPLRADKIKDEDIKRWLNALTKQGLVFLYEAEGKPYLKMTSWEKHQQVRAKRSKYPQPDSDGVNVITNDNNCNQKVSNVPENPIRIQSESESESESKSKQKKKFAEFISLTNDEHTSLVAKIGKTGTERCIEILDNYKGSTGKKYKSDYRTILNWVIKRYEEEECKKGGTGDGVNSRPIEGEAPATREAQTTTLTGFKMATEPDAE